MLIIDAHNHPDWYQHNIDKHLQNMAACGISRTWLFSWECNPDEYSTHYRSYVPDVNNGRRGPISFERCARYHELYPDKFVIGYCPDPRRPEAIDVLEMAIDIHNVRVCSELKLRMMYDNPDALRMFRFCGAKGLPITIHIDYEFETGRQYPRPTWWYGGGIDAFERAVQACPETIFIGHAPGFWAHISDDGQHDKEAYPEGPIVAGGKLITMMREYPNLYCDTSAGSGLVALKRDLGFTKDFLIEFQDRVLYGRDDFTNDHQEFLDSLDLPADVLQKIYSGNALKLVPE